MLRKVLVLLKITRNLENEEALQISGIGSSSKIF